MTGNNLVLHKALTHSLGFCLIQSQCAVLTNNFRKKSLQHSNLIRQNKSLGSAALRIGDMAKYAENTKKNTDILNKNAHNPVGGNCETTYSTQKEIKRTTWKWVNPLL